MLIDFLFENIKLFRYILALSISRGEREKGNREHLAFQDANDALRNYEALVPLFRRLFQPSKLHLSFVFLPSGSATMLTYVLVYIKQMKARIHSANCAWPRKAALRASFSWANECNTGANVDCFGGSRAIFVGCSGSAAARYYLRERRYSCVYWQQSRTSSFSFN